MSILSLLDDTDLEPIEETMRLLLRDPVNAQLAGTLAIGTIIDDDQMLPDGQTGAIITSTSSLTVVEGNTAGSSFNIRLSSRPTGVVFLTVELPSDTDLSVSKSTYRFFSRHLGYRPIGDGFGW